MHYPNKPARGELPGHEVSLKLSPFRPGTAAAVAVLDLGVEHAEPHDAGRGGGGGYESFLLPLLKRWHSTCSRRERPTLQGIGIQRPHQRLPFLPWDRGIRALQGAVTGTAFVIINVTLCPMQFVHTRAMGFTELRAERERRWRRPSGQGR